MAIMRIPHLMKNFTWPKKCWFCFCDSSLYFAVCVCVCPTGVNRWGMCGRVQWRDRAEWEWETGGDAAVHWRSAVMHTHYTRYVHRHTRKGVRRGKCKGLICRAGRWGESMRESFVSLVGPQTGWSRGGSGGWRPEFRDQRTTPPAGQTGPLQPPWDNTSPKALM